MTWNTPNALTLARLCLLPAVVGLVWPGIVSPKTAFWAAITYIAAGVLDVVDGHIARRTNQVTALGKFLDPLADKLFYIITLVALLQLPGPWVPPWIVMVVVAREFTITGLRAMAVAEGVVISAGEGGKVKTTFATAGMVGLLIHYPYVVHAGVAHFVLNARVVGLHLTYVSVLFSLTSAVGYVRDFLRVRTVTP
jgi:CDP-diacylglycerol--glycerol-3-phosphate 3-phosphatidyltransferase